MTRLFLTTVALAAFPLNSPSEEATVQLTVRPMPAPKPALKYQLLPEVGELNPGNAAQNYLKCFMEQRHFFYSKEAIADRARYLALPLAELPASKLRDYGGNALRHADWAARLDTLDWQTIPTIQRGGIEVLPAELGPLQVLAAALQVRFRAQVAGGDFEGAIRSAKTMFALARHLGEHPTEAADSVGLWVAHLGLGTVEEMVQQPKCPNLYWALTDLPCPLVDLHKGVQGDRTLVAAELRVLRDDAPMTEPDIEKFVSRLSGVLSFAREQAGQPPRSLRRGLQARAKDPDRVCAARRRLVEAGCAEKLVNQFVPLQVILLDAKRDYEVERDERIKLLALPLWQIDARAAALERERGGEAVFADLLPQIIKLRRAQGQLEQHVALLRHVEALRLYAADHDGKMPGKPSDFTVPLPVDPVTGQPFVYSVEGGSAHVRSHSLPGEDRDAKCNVHYVVTVQK
jgi:hypothetical protein